MKGLIHSYRSWPVTAIAAAAWMLCASQSFGALASLCAEVKLQITQEAAIERQAFDAELNINNGLTGLDMTGIDVSLEIRDENDNLVLFTSDPNDTNAFFFVSSPELININNISGGGTVAASTAAQVRWLLIPAAGAAGTSPSGRRYFIGGSLSYVLNGQDQTIDITPAQIFVRPQPRLELDYFIPGPVYADDAFTAEIEPAVPFTLGLRVRNAGYGTARNLQIDAGQPEIVENELGLLIGFSILGSEVNGQAAQSSLRVAFGEIEGGYAGTARWQMKTTLSGSFTNFSASFSHADEYGGELTSLIDEVRTHQLIHDVRVDAGGRDDILDFLALDGSAYTVYESDNLDLPVTDVSSNATLTLVDELGPRLTYSLTLPDTAGALYSRVTFGNSDGAEILSVIRDDGKQLPIENAWFAKTREIAIDPWDHWLDLFDTSGGGIYTIVMDNENVAPKAPVLDPIGDKVTRIGDPALVFQVTASDPNGSVPTITSTPLPPGATLTDITTNGTAVSEFDLTAGPGTEGVYPIRFVASDGALEDSETIKVYIGLSGEGSDSNGVPNSLTNWAPTIVDLLASTVSGTATVVWDSVSNLAYDVYASDDAFGSNMTWSLLGDAVEAVSSTQALADVSLGTALNRRFYQVRLDGDPTSLDEVWGVIRRPVAASTFTLLSSPLQTDRRFDGDMGAALAETLGGDDGGAGDELGDEIRILESGGTWRTLYLDDTGAWRESGGALSTLELAPGQGFVVMRYTNVLTKVTFTGPVGNDGTSTNTLTAGWNLIGPSEGLVLDAAAAFENGSSGGPQSGNREDVADLMVFLKTDGRWTRYMRVHGWGAPYEAKWINLDTGLPLDLPLEPGRAYYYFRQSSAGPMEVTF